VITIGQLARYVGVSTKTIRVYHAKGLLPEPERDASGYRRYSAADAIELIKIRTLAESGVPLARIRELEAATGSDFQSSLAAIDAEITTRINALHETQRRLRELASGHNHLLPNDVDRHLQQLGELGFSPRWQAMERDLWILVFATRPETAHALFADQAGALAEPALHRMYLEYDRAYDLDPQDPSLTDFGPHRASHGRALRHWRTPRPGGGLSHSPAHPRLRQRLLSRLGTPGHPHPRTTPPGRLDL
jgi:DNA-binding transcriptional MerR regulator